jgi:DNA-binding CsgD family transcriptional regulator
VEVVQGTPGYEDLFAWAPLPLCVTRGGIIRDCNEMFSDAIGVSRGSLVGRALNSLFRDGGRQEPAHAAACTGDESPPVRLFQRSCGRIHHCRVQERPLVRGDEAELSIWALTHVRAVDEGDFGLSVREREIAACLLCGMTSKEIGRVLDLSHRTVAAYRDSLRRKCGADDLAGLFRKLGHARASDARARDAAPATGSASGLRAFAPA